MCGFRRTILTEDGSGGCCGFIPKHRVDLGIEFVAMKRTIGELPKVVSLAQELGASRLLVTNVLPYTREMQREALYDPAVGDFGRLRIELPPMVGLAITPGAVLSGESGIAAGLPFAGSGSSAALGCPFIEQGAGAIGQILDCIADPSKIRAIASLSDEMDAVFPYLNAVCKNITYNHESKTVILRDAHRLITLYPKMVTIAKADGEFDARRVLANLQNLINEVWVNWDRIKPSYERRQLLSPVEVYRLLPRTN